MAYVESASVKIKPTRELPDIPLGEIAISAARNEFEPFQVAINGGLFGVANVTASVSALVGPGGATIGAENLWLYRVDLVEVTTPSGSIGEVGVWPDPLVPARDEILGEARGAFPFDVAIGETRAIWGEVLVPEGTPAGEYAGSVWVEGDNFAAEIPLRLTVHGFSLPSTPSLTTAFLAWLPNICLAHTGDATCGDWQTAAILAERYARLALDHRITLSNVWVGRDHTEDWADFDRHFGPLLDGTAQTRLLGARMSSAQITGPRTVEKFQSWVRHFRERGWFDRLYDYTADEPPYGSSFEEIPARAELAKAADAALSVLVTTNIDSATENGIADWLDIIAPVVNHLDTPTGGDQRDKYDAFVGEGGRLWLYQSCMSHGCSFGEPSAGVAWPSYMVDVSAAKNRLMQWVLWRYGVTGELYYETALAFSADPWAGVFQFSGNGDGTLFYPGTPARVGGEGHVPVASIRLKMIREGIEDFEYLRMLERLGEGEWAKEVARQVMPTAYGAHDDASRIKEGRRLLAERLAALTAEEGPGGVDSPEGGEAGDGAGDALAGTEGEGSDDSGTGSDSADTDDGSAQGGQDCDTSGEGAACEVCERCEERPWACRCDEARSGCGGCSGGAEGGGVLWGVFLCLGSILWGVGKRRGCISPKQ